MRHAHGFQKTVAGIVAVAFLFVGVIVAPVQAAMVGTADLLRQQSLDGDRHKVLQFMERQDVSLQLQQWGVTPEEAKDRVRAMTDEEISLLVHKIDEMPAGGDALGFMVALAVVVFVVLLITDIIGVTDVFTFIKKR